MISIKPLIIIISIVILIIALIVLTYKDGPMAKKEGLNSEQTYIVNTVKKLDNVVNSYSDYIA